MNISAIGAHPDDVDTSCGGILEKHAAVKHNIQNHPIYGKCLFADNGIIEVGIPLEFGLRVGHFAFCGGKNVFFEQPADMTAFTTDQGWRIRGGHRLWLAPERSEDYYPDNAPIAYEVSGDTIVLTQTEDPWLRVVKQFVLTFDGSRLQVTHKITNTGASPLECSLWAISVVAPGGTETINFQRRDGGMDHWHRISMWDYTSLGDPRVSYTRDQIVIRHQPLDERYKIGVGHPYGPIRYENGDTVFLKHFAVDPQKRYPDADVSYETYCSRYMMELESLSPLETVAPGGQLEHTEVWELLHKS